MSNNEHDDGVDRRGFLTCMAWAGTGAFFIMDGGILKSYSLSTLPKLPDASAGMLRFAQISDSHMGFNKAANPDVVGTLQAAVERINALPSVPEFMLHTGDNAKGAGWYSFDTKGVHFIGLVNVLNL